MTFLTAIKETMFFMKPVTQLLAVILKKRLQILTEEAFANTCELLGALDAQDQAHKLFYEVNSYTFLFESRTFLKRAFNELGEDFIFKLFLMLYLYSNFLKPGLDDKLFNRTIQFLSQNSRLNLDMKSMKNLKELSKLPFTLDLRFRTITTGLHLRLSGVDQDISKIVDFDILGFVSKDTNRTNYINEITGIALMLTSNVRAESLNQEQSQDDYGTYKKILTRFVS